MCAGGPQYASELYNRHDVRISGARSRQEPPRSSEKSTKLHFVQGRGAVGTAGAERTDKEESLDHDVRQQVEWVSAERRDRHHFVPSMEFIARITRPVHSFNLSVV